MTTARGTPCASCGHSLPQDASFCPACGLPQRAEAAQACPACQANTPAKAQFCPSCGANLSTVAEADRRVITVMFADLSGFTGLTEKLDAEEVHDLIARWLDPLCECVTRWGGFVDKFIGDCIMALFGAPVAYENEEERAIRAALDMQMAIDSEAMVSLGSAADVGGYRPNLSIGINTGPVVTCMFSGGGALDYTVVGDVVNVASRLQGICDPGGVLVGEATYRRTQHLFEFGDASTLQVKGRAKPVVARPALGLRNVRGATRGFADRSTPHIGRMAELERLRESWRRTASDEAQVALLVGPPGIGKSRLVAELALAEELSAEQVARGRSYPYAASTPWEPIAELIRDLFDIRSGTPPSEAARAVARNAPNHWSDEEVAALSAVFGSQVAADDALGSLAPEERRGRMEQAVIQAIETIPPVPRLLVLEDLHWADRTTLDFLTAIADLRVRGPFLFVLVTRPPLPTEQSLLELIDSFDNRIEIGPLSSEESRLLVETVLGDHQLPEDLIAMVLDRSGGIPLFIEEIVKAVIESGAIEQASDGTWCARDGYREVEIPDSIDSLLTTRIDRLDPATKRVLQYAALVGRRFWSGVLRDALAQRPVDSELEELEAGDLVRQQPESVVADDREFAFEHLMLQEVAYGGLLRGLRSEMHGTVAEWLEDRLADESPEFGEFVAYHYERSKTPERALPFLERAIRDAWKRGALLDAEVLLDRAIGIAADADTRARLLGTLEEVATAVGEDARRLEAIDEMTALAESVDDPAIAAEAMYRRARRLLDIGDLAEARRIGGQALEPFRALGNGSSEADVLRLLGRVAHLWGAYDEALERYHAALPLERAAGDRYGEAEILRRLGLAETDFGNFTRALEYFDQALQIYAEINHRPRRALAMASRAMALRWLGRYQEAEVLARQAEEIALACGSRSAGASALLSRAITIGAAGRAGEATELLTEVLDMAGELHRSTLEARAWLALAELEAGQRASAAAQRARDVAARSGLIDIEVFGLTRLAELAVESGELAAADRDSARAIELLEEHGDVQGPDEVVYYVRSGVLAALGRDDEARAALARSRAIVEKTASGIADPETRRSFLERVEPNPRIMALGTDA